MSQGAAVMLQYAPMLLALEHGGGKKEDGIDCTEFWMVNGFPFSDVVLLYMAIP